MNALPEERLGQLRVAKLRALLGSRLDGETELDAAPFGIGAALRTESGLAAFLIEEADERSLGGTLVWALRKGATRLLVIVDADVAIAGRLAREASYFALPIVVERIVKTAAVVVEPAPFADPKPLLTVPEGTDAVFAAADVDVVVEHGVTKAEVEGIEVARVAEFDGELRLEFGIGKFDREISAMMNANLTPDETLRKAVAMVRTYRFAGATIHPLRDLVPERWMRTLLLRDPSLIGAAELHPVDSTMEPQSLRESQPTAAAGTLADGTPVVVVCTAGTDLDAVPHAADTRASVNRDAQLLICAPKRNLLAPLVAVGAALTSPARFVELELPY